MYSIDADDGIFLGSEADEEGEAAHAGRWGIARSNTIGTLTEYVLDKDRHEKKGLRKDVDFVRQLARSVSAATPAGELDAVKFNPSDRLIAWLAGIGPLLTSLTEMQLDKGPQDKEPRDSSFASSRLSFRAAHPSTRPLSGPFAAAYRSSDLNARPSAGPRGSSQSLRRSTHSLRHSLHAHRSASSVHSHPGYRSSFASLASFAKPHVKVRATLGIGVKHASGRLGATRTPAFVSACAETLVHESIESLDDRGSADVAKAIAPFASREPSWWDSLQLWLVTTREEREYLQAVAAEDRREERELQLRQSTEAFRRSQARTVAVSRESASARVSTASSRRSAAWASSTSLKPTPPTRSPSPSPSQSSRASSRPCGAGLTTGTAASTTAPAPLPPPTTSAASSHRQDSVRRSTSAADEGASRRSRSSRATAPDCSARASAQEAGSGGETRMSRSCGGNSSTQSSIGAGMSMDESTTIISI